MAHRWMLAVPSDGNREDAQSITEEASHRLVDAFLRSLDARVSWWQQEIGVVSPGGGEGERCGGFEEKLPRHLEGGDESGDAEKMKEISWWDGNLELKTLAGANFQGRIKKKIIPQIVFNHYYPVNSQATTPFLTFGEIQQAAQMEEANRIETVDTTLTGPPAIKYAAPPHKAFGGFRNTTTRASTRANSGHVEHRPSTGYAPGVQTCKKRPLSESTSQEKDPSQDSSYTNPQIDDLEREVPDADDEQSVNTAMILLLKELSVLVRPRKVDWTIDRVRFKPQFAQTDFTTCTDGAMILCHDNSIIAIVKAKRGLRVKNQRDIRMQEAAKLVGWLLDKRAAAFPGLKGHALIISQDRHQLFLTFVPIKDDYIEYLTNPRAPMTSAPHIALQPYGPFNTFLEEHMREFAALIVSLTLMASE
ncbi:hypothetical protein BJY00DRAFT_312651 [Aspergillus carlsbadensis]|nr:hypothetical protein BJY00DRAFT_312651 [Aspergillus carlsbadensis]